MLKSYNGIESEATCTIIVQKSKFISYAIPIFTKEDINKNLKRFREQYYDATHICYAYILNENGVQEKYSDDGEPSGTAGYPICNVLKKKNLTNVLIVVVRYFGKIKLGAGGLTRTYGACASSVLEISKEHKYILAKKITIQFESGEYFKYVHLINSSMVKIKKESFEDYFCNVEACVNEEDVNVFLNQLKNINPNIDIKCSELFL